MAFWNKTSGNGYTRLIRKETKKERLKEGIKENKEERTEKGRKEVMAKGRKEMEERRNNKIIF